MSALTIGKPGFFRFRWYTFLAAFLILPNLPLLLGAHPISLLARGYVDLDYLLIGLLSLFVPRMVTFVLLAAAVLFDFVHAVCVTYLFAPSEFFHVVRYGGLLSTTRVGLIASATVFTLLICLATTAFASRRAAGRQRRIAIVTMSVTMLLFALADVPAAHRVLQDTGEPVSGRLTRTPTLGLIYGQIIYDRYQRGQRLGGQYAMPSATSLALNYLADYPARDSAGTAQDLRPNLVLVLVESWGLARDPALRSAMLEPYSDPALLAKYEVLRGTMPFQGPTTAGEKRELCQSHMGLDFAQGTPAQLERCVPSRMRRAGYRTLAVHGFSGDFFDRKDWYPKLGFEDIWFHDRLRAAGLPDCGGPFPGTCDDAVAGWLSERLRQPGDAPLFVHWVTLNSHLPISPPYRIKSPRPCNVSSITRDDAAVCTWYQLVSVANQSVHDLALGSIGRPTIFVVVGDHAPPFDTDVERAQFSATQVPYVILLPKEDAR